MITNWHNVTGQDPISGQSISTSGAQPTHLEVPILLKTDMTADKKPMAMRKRCRIELYETDGTPRWIENPAYNNQVDVVALKIAPLDGTLVSRPINTLDLFVDFEPIVGDDVFVLGYPGGVDGGNELAIWKRGSIAS